MTIQELEEKMAQNRKDYEESMTRYKGAYALNKARADLDREWRRLKAEEKKLMP